MMALPSPYPTVCPEEEEPLQNPGTLLCRFIAASKAQGFRPLLGAGSSRSLSHPKSPHPDLTPDTTCLLLPMQTQGARAHLCGAGLLVCSESPLVVRIPFS